MHAPCAFSGATKGHFLAVLGFLAFLAVDTCALEEDRPVIQQTLDSLQPVISSANALFGSPLPQGDIQLLRFISLFQETVVTLNGALCTARLSEKQICRNLLPFMVTCPNAP